MLLCILVLLISALPACHRSGSYSDNGSVVVIEDPCLDSPLPSYPPGYPQSTLELDPFVPMEPITPSPPDGISCIPSAYLVAPPLPQGLLLDEVTGTISGTPEVSDSSSEHVITAIFPDATEDFLMAIIILPLPPAFTYPVTSVTLGEDEEVILQPTQLPGSGAVASWSVETPGAPPLSAIVDTDSGVLALYGGADFTATIIGVNAAGSASFSIDVTTIFSPAVLTPLIFEDDGDGIAGVGDVIRIETSEPVVAPSDGAVALPLSPGSSLGSESITSAGDGAMTLIHLGEGALLHGRGASTQVGGSSAPQDVEPTHSTPTDLIDPTTGLATAATAIDLFPGVRTSPIHDVATGRMVAADVDGDGRQELVAITDGQLVRMTRSTDGSWQSTPLGGSALTDVAVADVDTDGDLDLIATGTEGIVWFDNQDGVFTLQTFDGTAAGAIAIADLDRDGALDLLVSRDTGTVDHFAGDGSGNFSPVESLAIDGSGGIEVVDLDRDGRLDVATAQPALLRGSSSGLTPWIDAPLPTTGCTSVALVDADVADGWKSILWSTTDSNLHRIDIIDGQLQSDITTGLTADPATIYCADLDTDGGRDTLLLVDDGIRLHGSRGPLPVDGEAVTSAAALWMEMDNPTSVCSLDLDGDGDLDVVASGPTGMREGINSLDTIRGSLTLQLAGYSGPGHDIISVLAVADLTRSGHLDRIVSSPGSAAGLRTTWLIRGDSPSTSMLLVDGPDVRSCALLDTDLDGDLDVVLGVRDGTDLLLIQESAQNFQLQEFPGAVPGDITNALTTGDVNGDGVLDLVTGCHGLNRIWIGDGNGSFVELPQIFPTDVTHAVLLDDFDGDGDLDLLSGNSTGRHNRYWINDGSGSFSDSGQILGVMEVRSFASGDIDGDGDLDLILGQTGSGPSGFSDTMWFNDGSGHFTEGPSPDPQGAATLAVALGDLDLDGDLDLATATVTGLHIQWNLDGSFSTPIILSSSFHDSVHLVDIDGDGDLDLQSASLDQQLESWLAR